MSKKDDEMSVLDMKMVKLEKDIKSSNQTAVVLSLVLVVVAMSVLGVISL